VISRTEAAAIAEAHLNSNYATEGTRFVVKDVNERPSLWVVFYDSEAHVKSQSFLDQLAGNRSLVVSKATGNVAVITTPAPTEAGIAAAEAKLGPAENGRICMDPLPEGWHPAESRAAKAAETELTRELHHSHALYGLKTMAIARRRDSDEWLFLLESGQVAQVHLTYAVESTSAWPRSRIFSDESQWRQSVAGSI
jgi:hypothetical protein